MKKLTKAELQQSAERLMKAHNSDKIFATQDGNFFLQGHEANSHNRELKKDVADEWEVFDFATSPAETSTQDSGNQPKGTGKKEPKGKQSKKEADQKDNGATMPEDSSAGQDASEKETGAGTNENATSGEGNTSSEGAANIQPDPPAEK